MTKTSDPSGHLVGEMKWLVTRYPKKPGDMIKLGSILKRAEEPEESLNLKSIHPIPTDARYDESVAVRARITSELSKHLGAILEVKSPDNPIVKAAAKVQADKSQNVETVVEAMNVRAEIFLPDEEYINNALANSSVVKYLKKGYFSHSVYMIIGVATAEKLSLTESMKKEKSASAGMEVSAAGDAAGAKAETSAGKSATMTIEREIDGDCDFAYRVREIGYSKFTIGSQKWTDKGNVVEGTMFSGDAESQSKPEEDTEKEEGAKFDEWMEEDEGSDDLYVF